MGYLPPSLSETASNRTWNEGVLELARFTENSGTVPRRAVAYVPMIPADSLDTGNLSAREFQTLLSGKMGHPPTLRVCANVFRLRLLAIAQEYRPAPSRKQTSRASGEPA